MEPPAGENAEPERATVNRRSVLIGGTALAWSAPVLMTTRPNPALAGTPADEPEPQDEVEPQDEPERDEPEDGADETNEPQRPDRPDDEVGPEDETAPTGSVESPEPDRQPDVEPAAGEEPTPISKVKERVVERTSGGGDADVQKALADTGLHAGWLSATGTAALTVGTLAMRAAKRQEARSAAGTGSDHPADAPAGFPVPPERPDNTDG